MGPHAADPVFLGANEGAPLLRDIPSKSPSGKAIASARRALTAPVTFVVFLAIVVWVLLQEMFLAAEAWDAGAARGHDVWQRQGWF